MAVAVVLALALALAALVVSGGCASSSAMRDASATSRSPAASNEIVDLASEFLSTACQAPPGADFAKAWLAYEDRHRRFFDAIYYTTEAYRAERVTLAEALGPRRDEVCGQVRAFLVTAPGTIERLRARVTDLLGHAPRSPIYFAVALQGADGRADIFDNQQVLALNARHDTFARTTCLAVTLAHELIHDVQTAAATPGVDQSLSPVARALYREGGAVFGVQRLFPEIGARALGLRPEQVERADVVAPQAAQELLRLIRAPDLDLNLDLDPGAEALQRFFNGGYADPLYPPKMGYYLGNKIYRALAERLGAAASRVSASAFLTEADAYLADLSRQSVQVPPPGADRPAIIAVRDAFLAKARSAGLVLSFLPEVREWTRPSMISWRQEVRAVAVPRWDELSEPQRSLLVRMVGGDGGSRHLFDVLFRWFLVPHELTHALQDNLARVRMDHAMGERMANDVAVAFLAAIPESRRPLFALALVLVQAKERLPSLANFQDEEALNRYFNDHYDELGRDLPQYGAFQVHFILDSLRRLDALRFEEAVRRAVD
ncbi:MAG: hypothetical protein H6729_01200 [Deltaproteobacteria bacterium]|nr:hypothetical protein [Deltaproteobacteria bacterium]